MNSSDFPAFFKAIWDVDPFPWQTMLAARVAKGKWPRVISLPTAAGKTACLDIAVFVLALEAPKPLEERRAPRRTWFTVDRRIVVDEAFERANEIAEALKDPTDFLRKRELKKKPEHRITRTEFESSQGLLNEVAERLKSISGTDRPLATARLRGGVLRDDGWARLPSQPTIITSTVDQLGSRLLFRAYVPGDCIAPIHAALAGNDSLILLDEAHCAVPFAQTLTAIERFRGPLWCDEYLPQPFSFSILSATPPEKLNGDVFPAEAERPAALNHPKLHKRANAAKPAQLREAKPLKGSKSKPLHIGALKHEDPLVLAAAEQSCVFCKDETATRTAVMVNRVATADAIANILNQAVGTGNERFADIVLLTGRMRPLDRDALVDKWSPYLKANSPETPTRPIILVTTQCLEVGADFSFDALVTECASLDALRQRFGRLNRLGAHNSAPGVILARSEDVKPNAEDPIYGKALTRTWAWLTAHELQPVLDFGITSMDRLLVEKAPDKTKDGKNGLMAPTDDAPILLPAHLDMLCQTSPRPDPEPEVSLFLHGKRSAQAHAFVVWRCDLGDETRNWQKTVALLPPSSGEMLEAPLFRVRRWLAAQAPGRAEPDGDVESSALRADEDVPLPAGKSMFLIWRGRRKQPLCSSNPDDIRRGDIVVVSASTSPHGLGQHVPPDGETTGGTGENRADLAERAWHACRGQAVLRITPLVLTPWESWQPISDLLAVANDVTATRQEIHAALDNLLTQMEDPACPLPQWLKKIVTALKKPRSEIHPSGGLVLFGPKSGSVAEEIVFGDEDDEFADTERGTTLNDHTADVLHYGGKFASQCLPEPLRGPVLNALRVHDIGKLDLRVQLMLHGGDEVARDASLDPLAKSAPNSAKKSREECGLPGEFRHEMLSLQIAEHCGWLPVEEASAALTAHLISSHHGYGRPWPPIARDRVPPGILLHNGIVISQSERLAWTPAHHIASGIGDRFWQLTRRFGWWGLPMVEAVVRLSDWYASRFPRKDSEHQNPHLAIRAQCLPSKSKHEIPLAGLDPSNPVGWLATLGTFRLASRAWPENQLKLGWHQASGGWRPTLFSSRKLDLDDLVSMLDQRTLDLRVMFSARLDRARNAISPIGKKGERKWQDTLKYPLAAYLHFCRISIEPRYVQKVRAATQNNHIHPLPRWEFAASWASEMSPKEHKDPDVDLVKKTFFDFTSGQQGFVEKLRALRSQLSVEDIRSTLIGPWDYRHDAESMRWDPVDEKRQYALQAIDPSDGNKNPPISVIAVNALAAEALPLFPAIPTIRGHQAGVPSSEDYYAWCLWEKCLGLDSVRALVHAAATGNHEDFGGAFGIAQTFRSALAKSGKDYYCFTRSKVT